MQNHNNKYSKFQNADSMQSGHGGEMQKGAKFNIVQNQGTSQVCVSKKNFTEIDLGLYHYNTVTKR
jgi:hypothetical protein